MLKDKIDALNVSWLVESIGSGREVSTLPVICVGSVVLLFAVAAISLNIKRKKLFRFSAGMALLGWCLLGIGLVFQGVSNSESTKEYQAQVNTLVSERMTEKYSVTPETSILRVDLITEGTIVVADSENLTTYKVTIGFNEAGDLTLRHLDGKELDQIFG